VSATDPTPPPVDDTGSIRRRWIIVHEPGLIPEKKGPFATDAEACDFLCQLFDCRPPGTHFTMLELTWDFDLWATSGRETLYVLACAQVERMRAPSQRALRLDVALCPFHVIELCAGAGGLGLGIELAVPGARGVAYVEREAYAAARWSRAWKRVTWLRRLSGLTLPPSTARPWRGRVHCVTSGDPCQPNSVAGKGLGADDERFLIDQVLRVVDEAPASPSLP
jgi:hypothetical protein